MKKRIDFFFFRNFLFALGIPFTEASPACQSVRLIFGINKPFSVIVNGNQMNPRILYIDSEAEVVFEGDNTDLLFQAYIPDFTHLASLLKKILFQEKKSAHFEYENELDQTYWRFTSRENDFKTWEVYSLFELLLKLFIRIEPVTTAWNSDVRELVHYLDHADLASLNISELLGADSPLPLKGSELSHTFYKVTGVPLESYLFQHKVNAFLKEKMAGVGLADAARQAGLGDSGPAFLFLKQSFGIDFSALEYKTGFFRYFFSPESELANFRCQA